jgi:hypothetical protein
MEAAVSTLAAIACPAGMLVMGASPWVMRKLRNGGTPWRS